MPSQVESFINQAESVINPPDAPAAPENTGPQPLVPFQTPLKLTADQETKMIDWAFARKDNIANETGRDQTLDPIWWNNSTWGASVALASQGLLPVGDTFFGKRSRFDATFYNDVSWRPFTMGPNTIFTESNIPVPLSRRICRQMIAKAKNMFFGTDEWFSVDPAPVVPQVGGIDRGELDDKIEKFCQFKLRESNAREDHGAAIARALVLGECAVKTSYVVRDQIFNTEMTVLHDIDGQPTRAADGNFITQQDQFIDAQDGSGTRVLARDGVTEQPLAPIWQNASSDRRQVLFEGAKSEVIYYKDFLCPLTAASVQEADCVVHMYDKPVMAFVDLVVKRGMIGDTAPARQEAAQKMLALVKQLANNSNQPKAAVAQENRPNDHYVTSPSIEVGGPVAEFAEFYIWYDANGDGIAENIMLICDRNSRAPIFYDHVANVTTDGLRPIEIIRINPVEGRWYGYGIMELFESYQTITDLLVNRWNFSQSRAGRVDLWTPTNTLEGDREPGLKMNWGGTYTKKPGMKKEDVLESVYLTDVKFEQIQTMIQFFMQLAMNESGVSNANDDQAAGMQSSKLATGVIEVAKSGDELFKPIVNDLKEPLTRLLNREVDVTLANLNPIEVFSFFDGQTMGIDQITPDDVRGMKYKCTISLTSQRNQEKLQMSQAAAAIVERFYMLAPQVQQHVAKFYQTQLRSLDPTVDAVATIVPQPIVPLGPDGQPIQQDMGSSSKLGEGAPNTNTPAQLSQQVNKK